MKGKLSQCINASTHFICDALAPGQGEELKTLLLSSHDHNEYEKVPKGLSSLIKSYKSAPSQQVCYLILSLVLSNFSKADCVNFFGCSRYMIDQARKMRSEFGAGVIVPKVTFTRNKLDLAEVEHFIDFTLRWLFSRCSLPNNNSKPRLWRRNHSSLYYS